ncbi:MAG: acyl-CoA dehydrogenase, partial [Candidatus Hydrogenedentes bacterium]|nr:acyl-CoA dehydrogenase [Candidatus Hydrogenedentota bacterium]
KMYGTEEQKKKFLPRLAKGEISAFALTEPDVGSDPGKMGTTATPSEDGSYYLINGDKLWCTNGPSADILVVMAKTPPKIVNGKEKTQISAFIVEKSMPGFTVEHVCSFMGLKGLSNGLLRFSNVKVPKENIIGKPGDGLRIALGTLNTGRLGIPAASSGVLKRCITIAQQWCNDRVQWGVPIGKHQSIARKIGNLAADTFTMESVVWLACAYADRENADIRLEAAIAKYFCTEVAWKNLDEFLQVRGGRGYETAYSLYHRGDHPAAVEQWMRDARVSRIFEGSTEIMHLIMAREALDTHFKLAMPIMKPKPGQKESKAALIWKAVKFYAAWYPKQWLPASTDFKVKHLHGANQDHLAFVARTCKKLARTIFHSMAKYKEKLEVEQLILANFVDIGVDLFTMASSLAYAEAHLAQNPGDQSPQELADLYCKNARRRIAENFKAIKNNHNHMFNKVGDGVMEGRYRWLINDIVDDYPAAYRDFASKLDVLGEIDVDVPVHAK